MTIGGWVIYAVALFVIGLIAWMICSNTYRNTTAPTIIVSVVLAILLLIGMLWWFGNTEAGRRAMKSQQSNFNGGIERNVRVYDVNGGLIQEYSGKFDVDYDNDRIIFDDEKGKRHIIYYPTGTIIIDET